MSPDHIPEGTEFLEFMSSLEGEAEGATIRWIAEEAGQRAPKLWAALGTTLSLLDRAASCFWGCGGGDHTGEYLTGSVVGSATASLRLMRNGYYDQALVLLRSAGEIVNLMALFALDESLYREWIAADPQQRYGLAKPSEVQKRLDDAGYERVLNRERYALLSQIAHGTTQNPPQTHNAPAVPITGGIFQMAGAFLVLNETAMAVAFCAPPSTRLLHLDDLRRNEILGAARELAKQVGNITITSRRQMWESFRAEAAEGA